MSATPDTYYIGSDLKFEFTITATGFNQKDHLYTITIYSGTKVITYDSTDTDHIIVVPEEENSEVTYRFILLVPTEVLSSGPLKMVVTAKVPDSDFAGINPIDTEEYPAYSGSGGYRREVGVTNLGTVKKLA